MLLIFTLAQVFLAQTVSNRDVELDRLNVQLAEISNALQLQRNTNDELSTKLTVLRNQYQQGVFFQEALQEQVSELEKTAVADRETITVQLAEMAQLQHDIIALRQVRSDLESHIANLSDTLKSQLDSISRALQLEEQKTAGQQVELADLGQRLNTLLAERVNELEQYRSEFFGRLRQVLVKNQYIRIEGDRFLLPSELLFASASATLGEQGKQELNKLAQTLNEIAAAIPDDIDWILRIDGHTDKLPINTPRFPSNWELSTARVVSVVRYLATQGVAQKRMTAAGFGEFHPLDSGQSKKAYQRNRRIELKLTKR